MSSSCGTFARGAGYWHRRPVPGLCSDNCLGTRTCGQRERVAALGIRFLAPPPPETWVLETLGRWFSL